MRSLTRRNFLRLSVLGSALAAVAACAPAVPAQPAGQAAAKPAETAAARPTETATAKPVETATEAKAPTQAPKATAEKVHIRYQMNWGADEDEMWKQLFQHFNEKHPNIEIELSPRTCDSDDCLRENLITQMAAGTAPDVYQLCCWTSTSFVQNGQALNLQPYIDRDATEVNMKDFSSKQFGAWTLDGNIYALPYYTGTFCIGYNKEMFDEVGVSYPPDKWGDFTFDQYQQMCQKFVKRDDPKRWGTSNDGHGANWLTQMWLRGWGIHMVNPKDNTECLLCDPKAQECLEVIRKAINDTHWFAQGAETAGQDVYTLFLGRHLAMMEFGSWALAGGAESCTFKWAIAPMWKGPGGSTSHQSVDGDLAWSKSPHRDEAWEFTKELCSPTFETLLVKVAKYALQPSRRSVLPIYVSEMKKRYPVLEPMNLQLFADVIDKDLGEQEEMFKKDLASKTQILQPAFDQVFTENKAPVSLICKYAELVTKFNRGEVKPEDLGAEMDKIKQ
jgi:multiple sugar transport system substrate-binding protein